MDFRCGGQPALIEPQLEREDMRERERSVDVVEQRNKSEFEREREREREREMMGVREKDNENLRERNDEANNFAFLFNLVLTHSRFSTKCPL